jgi:flagellar M-ring protein FliF
MPLTRRLSLTAGLLVGVGGFAGLLWWSTQASFVPLMTGLATQDAGAIVEKLSAMHVPYQIGAGGSTIMVPETQVYELRLKLAGEGLPKGSGVGFEIFNEPNFGIDRFTEELNYQRALEGELQRTLRSLSNVQDARVHIVLPKKSLFERRDDRARASVTIHLFPGRVLAGEQVQAVVHLISSSVAGLDPDEVTVVDGNGSILAKGGDTLAALGQGLSHQRSIEHSLETRVVDILERIVGVGRVAARVSATLDLAQHEDTTESFDPESGVVRSEQTSEEETAGASAAPASGIPGARSNLAAAPTTPTPGLSGATNRVGRHSQTRNFELTKAVRHDVQPVGRLQRISVAVLVDGIRRVGADGAASYTDRTPEEMARIKSLVQKAVGYDAKRGDEIEVQSMAFEPPQVEPASVTGPSTVLPLVIRLWPALLATVALVGFGFIVTRRGSGAGHSLVQVPSTVREIEAMMSPPQLAANGVPALASPQSQPAPVGRPDPAHAAAVIKGWLAES